MIYMPLLAILLFLGPVLSAVAIRRSLSVRQQFALVSVCIFYGMFPLIIAWARHELRRSPRMLGEQHYLPVCYGSPAI
ncbi:hypothetical protein [Leptolyngbya sp. BC1307]|uniref:hypothetical protein n=1 Tax=Leptolyngbya sp. BC1307 TaxID=2029589 RepID=UPI00114094CE|nr:hypothetical protein [Leptolyngbya sp. BC1307]